MLRLLKLFAIAAAVVGALLAAMAISGGPPPDKPFNAAAPEVIQSAKAACRRAVINSLNDPDSAKFPASDGISWSANVGAGIAVAVFEGRAKNGFGALMLMRFACDMELRGKAWAVAGVRQVR